MSTPLHETAAVVLTRDEWETLDNLLDEMAGDYANFPNPQEQVSEMISDLRDRISEQVSRQISDILPAESGHLHDDEGAAR